MRGRREGLDPVMVAGSVAMVTFVLGVVAVLVEAPVVVWRLLHGELVALNPFVIAGATIGVWFRGGLPDDWDVALGAPAGTVPPLAFALVVDVLVMAGLLLAVWAVWLRVDRWRAQPRASGLRSRVRPRSWAKPRDWLHLQVRDQPSAIRRVLNRVLRILLFERRSPDRVDSWALGRLRGTVIGSAREMHLLVVAPTRSGKTMRLLVAQVRSHQGPVVVLSNKLDIVLTTYWMRQQLGKVWIFAPFSDLSALREKCCGWSPLRLCMTWAGAQRMAQSLADADTDASSVSDGGGRFYVREAVEKVLPPLLHAAAISGGHMVDVYRWLGSREELEEPRMILAEHDAHQAEQEIHAIQSMDARQFSFASSSTRQLVSAYRHHEVQIRDYADLDIAEAIKSRATIYVIAPDSHQEAMAPLNAAIVAEVVRGCEQRARHAPDPATLPVVKVVIDEAATLAPLRRLPAYLAMVGSFGMRFALCYQSLSQVRARYGRDADTILANSGARVFMGPIGDAQTCEEVIRAFGEEEVENRSRTAEQWGAPTGTTTSPERRPKLSVDDLQRLPEGDALLLHGRDLTGRVHIPFWWEAEGYRFAADAVADDRNASPRRDQQ